MEPIGKMADSARRLPPMAVNFGHWGRYSGRAALSLVFSLLLAVAILAEPVESPAQVFVGVSVTVAPPFIPVYVQPLCPGPGFIWVPGYWAWDPDFGYYWVPGVWVLAPFAGALWTPGYWAWSDGVFVWYEGYWGPVVGYYGGINYGFGYTGVGYSGGYWSGGAFYYNRSVNNISVTNITNVYTKRVVNVRPAGASFNGGPGGTTVRPTSEQLAAARERRFEPTSAQREQMRVARNNPRQRATINHGRPAVAATPKPGVFTGRGVVSSSRAGAPYKAQPGQPGRKAETGGRARTQRRGAEMQPRGGGPERMAPGPKRGERVAPGTQRGERVAPGPQRGERMAPGPQRGERVAPGPRKAPEQRVYGPKPPARRPEATQPQPSPQKEKAKGEKEKEKSKGEKEEQQQR